MKRWHLLSLMLMTLMIAPTAVDAQTLMDTTGTSKIEPSRLFPLLPSTDIEGAPDDAISTEAIKKITTRCKSVVPPHFPPSAHDSYCACSAAATQGTITVGELRELQKAENRKLGNAAFEKYVKIVMKPCMEDPIEDVEYMFCITSRDNDWRIRYPVPFCKCVSRGIRKHFEQYGLEEMMIGWGRPEKMAYDSPTDTLWEEDSFLNARNIQKDQCVGSYMDRKNFR